jgi:hypothetical protein
MIVAAEAGINRPATAVMAAINIVLTNCMTDLLVIEYLRNAVGRWRVRYMIRVPAVE